MSVVQPLNFIQARFHFSRRFLTQPIALFIFFLSPLLNIFRIDVVQLKLIFWGQTYPFVFEYYRWIPIVFFAGVVIIALVSTIGGRIFCGWACPHNTLTELTRLIRKLIGLEPKHWKQKQLENKTPIFKVLNPVISLLFAVLTTYIMSTLLIFYFISPSFWLEQYSGQGEDLVIIIFTQGLLTLIGLFLIYAGHGFCKSACPYGLAQSLMAYVSEKLAPMEIRMHPENSIADCGACKGCQTACPVDLDPREFITAGAKLGAFDGCFNCGDCIDACRTIQNKKQTHQNGFLTFKLNPTRFLKTHPNEKL